METQAAHLVLKQSYTKAVLEDKSINPQAKATILCIGASSEFDFLSGNNELILNIYEFDPVKISSPNLRYTTKSVPQCDAILMVSNIGRDLIGTILNEINSLAYLRNLPILIHSDSPLNSAEIKKQFSEIDDVVSIDKLGIQGLIKKIKFIKKIKTRNTQAGEGQSAPTLDQFLYNLDRSIRRILDIVIASSVLLILIPVMILTAIIIKLESKGPIFYASYRAGSGYRIFKFYKFRSMVLNADKKMSEVKDKNQYSDVKHQGPVFFKIANDPRITRFGMLLRKTSLDELPQLLNVIKGDMSLVGNRPLPLYEAITLTRDDCAERFLAPAGITGLWQIKKRGNSEMSASERIGLDIAYAHNNSFWYDLKIMCKTPFSMTQKENV